MDLTAYFLNLFSKYIYLNFKNLVDVHSKYFNQVISYHNSPVKGNGSLNGFRFLFWHLAYSKTHVDGKSQLLKTINEEETKIY